MKLKLFAISVVLLLVSGVSQASTLLGDDIDVRYIQSGTPENDDIGTIAVTGTAQSLPVFSDLFTVTISSSQIVVVSAGYPDPYCCSFNGLYFINDTVTPFPSVSLDPSSVLPGGIPAISISGDTLKVNWGGESFSTGQLVLDVNATPLPAALPLFATSLGALGLLSWRRKRKAIAAA